SVAWSVTILNAAFMLTRDSESYRLVLGDLFVGIECQSVFFADSLVAKNFFAVACAIGNERASYIACEWDGDAAEGNGFVGVGIEYGVRHAVCPQIAFACRSLPPAGAKFSKVSDVGHVVKAKGGAKAPS